MLAVPGHEKVAPVIRGQRKVQRVAEGVSGHDTVLDVGLDDLEYGCVNGHDWQRRDQLEAIPPRRKVATLEFVDYGKTRDQLDA
jgi:hypothetical protein